MSQKYLNQREFQLFQVAHTLYRNGFNLHFRCNKIGKVHFAGWHSRHFVDSENMNLDLEYEQIFNSIQIDIDHSMNNNVYFDTFTILDLLLNQKLSEVQIALDVTSEYEAKKFTLADINSTEFKFWLKRKAEQNNLNGCVITGNNRIEVVVVSQNYDSIDQKFHNLIDGPYRKKLEVLSSEIYSGPIMIGFRIIDDVALESNKENLGYKLEGKKQEVEEVEREINSYTNKIRELTNHKLWILMNYYF